VTSHFVIPFFSHFPYVTVKRLAFLIRAGLREAAGSNPCSKTGDHDRFFVVFVIPCRKILDLALKQATFRHSAFANTAVMLVSFHMRS
jgi:hypothetical protein